MCLYMITGKQLDEFKGLFGDKFKHGDWTHITKDGVKKMVKDRLINSFGNSVPDDSPWGMDSLILELKEID